jgi:hypothetical protein
MEHFGPAKPGYALRDEMHTTSRIVLALTLLCGAALGLADSETRQSSGVDARGRTSLHYAAQDNEPGRVTDLLAAGSDVNAVDQNGDTPLHLAARRGNLAVGRLLLASGANVNARNRDGQTPLHVAGRAARPDVDEAQQAVNELAALLMARGANPDLRDNAGALAWPHATVEPAGDRQPSGYPTVQQIGDQLLARANSFPSICSRTLVGTSVQGRAYYALKISDNVNLQEDEPEFCWFANIHGDEVTGLVLCLDMIDYLLNNYATDSRVQNLVNNAEIWFVPTVNPDGYNNNVRYNANNYDLNRSFPEGSGPNPEPNTSTGRPIEVANVMNFCAAHSFTLSVNYHGGELVVNYPFDNDNMGSTFSPTPDEDWFVWSSEQYSVHNTPLWSSTSFTHGITNGAAWYAIDGGLQDWMYRYMGGHHVTIEISVVKSPAYSQMPTFWSQNQESMLSYMETVFTGVRGVVTDATTGAPLAATVTIVGRNHPMYTDPDVGDYHRPLLPGTYQVRVEAPGYETVTLPATVPSGNAVRLDVALGGPPVLQAPNGGETLTVGMPASITWQGAPTAQFHVQYSDNYGQTGAVTDGFETGVLGSTYTNGGSIGWYVTTGMAKAGVYSARAGAISHGQTSWMTRTAQAGDMSFWYRVYSEAGADWFNFYVDGVQKVHRAGNVAWTLYAYTLPAGTHTLKWEYVKDASVSGGSDTAWIDQVTLTGDATTWNDVIALTPVGATSTPWTPATASATNKVRVRAKFATGNFSSFDESVAVFTVSAPPTGACCAAIGTCSVLTAADCGTAGGTYQGDATVCDPNPCAPPVCRGDCNCDGAVGFADIDYFVAAIPNNEAAWLTKFAPGVPSCTFANCDVNGNSNVGFDDIDPFVALIPSSCP